MAEPAAVADAPPDVRLAVGALAAWLSVLATLVLPAIAGAGSGVVALLLALLALTRRRRWSATVALLLGCAGAAALATSARVAGVDRSPLTVLAERRASVTVELVLSDDPRPVVGGAGPPSVVVAARARQVTTAGRMWSLSDRVLVLAPAAGMGRSAAEPAGPGRRPADATDPA